MPQAAVAIVVAAMGLTGCGGLPGTASSSTTPAASSAVAGGAAPSGSPAGASGGADGAVAASGSPPADASDAPALRTVTFVTPDGLRRPNKYRLDVTALYRRGPFAVLEGRIACTQGPDDSCDGEFVLSQDSTTLNTPAGILLIDPAAKKEYLPVRDSSGRPYSSRLNPSFAVGTTFPFYVTYPAPPDGVTSLTVVLPGGGQPQVTDVPLR